MTDSARTRLARIAQIIEGVDNRCLAADGPVTPTLKEMTQDEISAIYSLASAPVSNDAELDADVRGADGIAHGTVADVIEVLDSVENGALYTALSVAHAVLYHRGINPKYGPEFGPGESDYPDLYGKLVQDIVTDALAGSPSPEALERLSK